MIAFGVFALGTFLDGATLVAGIAALASLALSLVGEGLGPRVATTILFAWVALVSYRLLRIAQEPTVASSAATVDI